MEMNTIPIPTGKPYEVLIGKGLLDRSGMLVREVCPRAEKAFVVADDRVAGLYLEKVTGSLASAGFRTGSFIFPHGEKQKTVDTWQQLLEKMCRDQTTRSDVLITLGGGVTGDLGGFAASVYQRGIDYIQIPTTLLAMVDSSVGGKTAVNLAAGKNQIGAFYQPKRVICDPETLQTLPAEEYRCGCAEIIKYAMIGSETFFCALKDEPVSKQIEQVISTCVEMKRNYVMQDEFDTGLRMMLNFGHTFGHACEACSGFSILHGQGVAIGMAMMARAAAKKGLLAPEDRDALIGLIRSCGLPVDACWSEKDLLAACLSDKKMSGSMISIVVPEKVGSCRIQKIPAADLAEWLRLGMSDR